MSDITVDLLEFLFCDSSAIVAYLEVWCVQCWGWKLISSSCGHVWLKRSGRWGVARPNPMPSRPLCLVPGIRARGLHHVWQMQAALVFKVDTKHTGKQHSTTLTAAASRQATWNRHWLPGTFVWLLLSKSPTAPDCPCLSDLHPSRLSCWSVSRLVRDQSKAFGVASVCMNKIILVHNKRIQAFRNLKLLSFNSALLLVLYLKM